MTGSTERIPTDRAWRNRIVGQGAKPASRRERLHVAGDRDLALVLESVGR